MARLFAAEIVVPRELDSASKERLIAELHAVHARIFDGVDKASFVDYVVDSRAEHTWILLYRGAGGELVGYVAFHVFEPVVDGETIAVVRIETGILRAYRGANATSAFLIDRGLRYIARHPRRPLYFLGSLVHPSSYAQFATYTPSIWPRQGEATPAPVLDLMQRMGATFGMKRVDAGDPLVREVGWRTIDSEADRAFWRRCERPGVQFFLAKNPGYERGHGLLVLLRVSLAVMLGFAGRYAWAKALKQARRLGARLRGLLPARGEVARE